MTRPIMAANSIRANMPFGTDVLSAQNAFDVAVRVDSQPRQHRLGNERDLPIWQWQKDNAQTLRRDAASPGG
jgi:cytochrome c